MSNTRNILEYLENTARRLPDKVAFVCEEDRITFSELRRRAASYGMQIAKDAGFQTRRPVCVIGERDINALICMLACVYSGNFYVLVDSSLPRARIEKMLDIVDFIGAVSCSKERYESGRLLFSDVYETGGASDGCEGGADADSAEAAACTQEELDRFVADRLAKSCSFDPLYGIFTSGTTGDPKLVVKSHSSLIGFIDLFTEMFGFEESDVLGNQFPFYFDASTKDLFCCLKCGLTVHIIPKKYFSFPQYLINYLIAVSSRRARYERRTRGSVSVNASRRAPILPGIGLAGAVLLSSMRVYHESSSSSGGGIGGGGGFGGGGGHVGGGGGHSF